VNEGEEVEEEGGRGTQTERIASEWGYQRTRREGRGNQKQTGIQGEERSDLSAFHGQLEAHYYINFVSLSSPCLMLQHSPPAHGRALPDFAVRSIHFLPR